MSARGMSTGTRSAQSGLAPIHEALFPMGHLIIGTAILALLSISTVYLPGLSPGAFLCLLSRSIL